VQETEQEILPIKTVFFRVLPGLQSGLVYHARASIYLLIIFVLNLFPLYTFGFIRLLS